MADNLIEVAEAFEVIKKAMKDDSPSEQGSYAHSWHCNIACMCADAILDNDKEDGVPEMLQVGSETAFIIGNEAASRFMKLCFDVETKR